MKRFAGLLLCVALLLSGCSAWGDGFFASVTPHRQQGVQTWEESVTVDNYPQLCYVLKQMVASGTESAIISVVRYDQDAISDGLLQATQEVKTTDPIAAYAVEDITYELGTNNGQPAAAIQIRYTHTKTEIRKIRSVQNMDAAKSAIGQALEQCVTGVVLYVESYSDGDFAQMAEDYADENPQIVMETPQITVNVYPETGESRVVELRFAYQTSRDVLRSMQTQVSSVFDSAAIYVGGYSEEQEKYRQLYAFLMEFLVEGDYQLETSITPSYSLLRHGVGDAKAFATVYAAMCREAGLECSVVSGTKEGAPWYWNMVQVDGNYYHVDLNRCSAAGGYQQLIDAEMEGYVWDFFAYPESVAPTAPETTEPAETTPQDPSQQTTAPTE